MKEIKFCEGCKKYTLKENCGVCNKKTLVRKPARFRDIDVKYSKYRRMIKYG